MRFGFSHWSSSRILFRINSSDCLVLCSDFIFRCMHKTTTSVHGDRIYAYGITLSPNSFIWSREEAKLAPPFKDAARHLQVLNRASSVLSIMSLSVFVWNCCVQTF